MFTGNEQVWPFREQARPAPRGHKVPVPGDTRGARLVMDLLRRPDRGGRRRRSATRPARPTWSPTRRAAWPAWPWRSLRRDRAWSGPVPSVIAAGGFVMNPDMVGRVHPGARRPSSIALGSSYDDGLGIRLGMSAAARRASTWTSRSSPRPAIRRPSADHRADRQPSRGQRFVAEDSYHARTSQLRAASSPAPAAYLIVDSAACAAAADAAGAAASTATRPSPSMEQRLWACRPARSPPRWPGTTTTPPAATTRTSTRAPTGWRPQAPGPVGGVRPAARPGPVRRVHPGRPAHHASTGRCCGRTARSSPALYAAGACASNIAQDGKGYGSGTQLGEGSFFGRRAGRHAAQTDAAGLSPVAV